MERRRELGELIDQLGVTQQIDPDEKVCGAVVLLTVEEPDGHLSLRCAWSEGMTWIERIGLLGQPNERSCPPTAPTTGGSRSLLRARGRVLGTAWSGNDGAGQPDGLRSHDDPTRRTDEHVPDRTR